MHFKVYRTRLVVGFGTAVVAVISLVILALQWARPSSRAASDVVLTNVSAFLGTNLPKAYFWNGSVTRGEYAFYGFLSKHWRAWRQSSAPLPDTMSFLEVNRSAPFLAITLVVRHSERVDPLEYSVAVVDARGRVLGFNDKFSSKGKCFGYIRLTTDSPPRDLALPLEVTLRSPAGLQVDAHSVSRL